MILYIDAKCKMIDGESSVLMSDVLVVVMCLFW